RARRCLYSVLPAASGARNAFAAWKFWRHGVARVSSSARPLVGEFETGSGERPRAAAATRPSASSTLERIRCGETKEVSADDACRRIDRALPSACDKRDQPPFWRYTSFMPLSQMPAVRKDICMTRILGPGRRMTEGELRPLQPVCPRLSDARRLQFRSACARGP